eukprot:s4146_g4.t1
MTQAWNVLQLCFCMLSSGTWGIAAEFAASFPFFDVTGIRRKCRYKNTSIISPAEFVDKSHDVSLGYPVAYRSIVRLLALSLTGSLRPDRRDFPYARRFCGGDHPLNHGYTMVGMLRMQNVAQLVLDVVQHDIPGGFVEAGVWRGGTCIFAKALFNLLGEVRREVHLFDAFEAMGTYGKKAERLHVDLESVQKNFELFGVRDERVKYHQGLFKETMRQFWQDHSKSDQKIAILRIDANFYDSHQDALYYLYNFVPVGGYVIFDDLFSLPDVGRVWREFRLDQNLTERIIRIDRHSGYFKKARMVPVDFKKMRASKAEMPSWAL